MQVPLRALASELIRRAGLGGGSTFDGKRNVSQVCGYKDTLTLSDYLDRYKRCELAARVVETMPRSTWRGGGEVVENPDPDSTTPFEDAWHDLDERLNLWTIFQRADILAGLGNYAVILIGAPGELDQPLPPLSGPDDILYLQPYGQTEVTIKTYETDSKVARYGFPLSYQLRRVVMGGGPKMDRPVHWTRILHVADGLLDDVLNGTPRLQRIWNRLDDLDKVVGGGSEAFWKRADQGLQIDIDPTIKMEQPAIDAFKDEVDEYLHGLSRVMKTRGVNINPLGSDVANFQPQADTVISLIASGSEIPQRILMGSERGELASQQDRENWAERVADRRTQFAGPNVVRPFISRMMEFGAFPEVEEYDIWWPAVRNLSEEEKAKIVLILAQANSANATASGEIITADEIRDLYLEMEPLDEKDSRKPEPVAPPTPVLVPKVTPKAARRKWRKQILSIARQTAMPRRLSA